MNGICRLEQEGIKAVATSLAVSLLPDQIRMDWENRTEESREVPCVMDLIEFIRKKSDNPMYKEKPSQHPTEQKRGGRNQHSRQKASVNVSTPSRLLTSSPSMLLLLLLHSHHPNHLNNLIINARLQQGPSTLLPGIRVSSVVNIIICMFVVHLRS